MLKRQLDLDLEHEDVGADSASSGECCEALLHLSSVGFESLIYEKCACHHPLIDPAKQLNRGQSAIRPWVEHVVGVMTL